MAFEGLSEKLQGVFSGLKNRGTLTEADINSAMREIKLALLEADVNYKVVKDFVAVVKEKALGEEVLKSVTPGQQIIKIVNDELGALMGGANSGSVRNQVKKRLGLPAQLGTSGFLDALNLMTDLSGLEQILEEESE